MREKYLKIRGLVCLCCFVLFKEKMLTDRATLKNKILYIFKAPLEKLNI